MFFLHPVKTELLNLDPPEVSSAILKRGFGLTVTLDLLSRLWLEIAILIRPD